MSGGPALAALALGLLLAPGGPRQAARPGDAPHPAPVPVAPAVVCRCECAVPVQSEPGCWGHTSVVLAAFAGLLAGLGLGGLGAVCLHSLSGRGAGGAGEGAAAAAPAVRGLLPLRVA